MDGFDAIQSLFTGIFADSIGSSIALAIIVILCIVILLVYLQPGIDVIMSVVLMACIGLTYAGFIPNPMGVGVSMTIAAVLLWRYYMVLVQ
jgi:hypothetical protein